MVLESIPEKIRKACEEPCGAAAVVYALLLDSDPAIRRKQLEYLESRLGKPVAEETRRISAPVSRLGEAFFIPIADLALVSLKDLSEPQKEAFREAVGFLSEADRQLSLFEYTLQQMIFRRLQTSAEKQRGAAVAGTDAVLENACVLLSVTARMGHWEETEIQRAFLAGRARIEDLFPKARDLSLLPLSDLSYPRITAAIEALSRAPFPQQECLLAALTDTVLLDGTVTIQEAEILRAIADGLGAPVPPLLPSELTEAS
ncbi:MAG: hypothetical protein D6679_00435 [Candidatus Hydrogenedentota bacterium]|nr:MAG: hypothetical protein D6679_00435 [Candidatus Hydrogenedentota bacterium]